MNNVSLIGRLARDPELRYTQSGTAVANGSIAVQRNFKNANGEYEADFINFVAWRKTGELIAEHFKKADMIGITGRIQTRSYENREGKTVYVTEVIAEQITFLNNGKGKTSNDTKKPDASDIYGETFEIKDSDLPF